MAAVTTLALGGRLFSSCNIDLSVMVWRSANGFGEMRRSGARVKSVTRERRGWHERIQAFTEYRCRYGVDV